jgi:hypothetical protein
MDPRFAKPHMWPERQREARAKDIAAQPSADASENMK